MKKQSLINCIILITFGSFCIGQQDMFSSGSNRPRANAGPDIQIMKDQKINLDASRSFIRDGSKLKFEWILSPGVALKSDNMLNNAISIDLYRDKYLKTIQTNEKTLEIVPAKNKIGTNFHYPVPAHLQKPYINLGYKKGDFPVTETIANSQISIPIFPEMKKNEIDYVIRIINNF